jgi:hypothetical protein
MSDASDFLKKWVCKNITPTTAHIRRRYAPFDRGDGPAPKANPSEA